MIDGRELDYSRRTEFAADGALELPPGALDLYQPGDLIGLRVDAGGLAIVPVTVTGEWPPTLLKQIGPTVEDGDERPEMLQDQLWNACLADPTLFRQPLSPIGEVLSGRASPSGMGWCARLGSTLTPGKPGAPLRRSPSVTRSILSRRVHKGRRRFAGFVTAFVVLQSDQTRPNTGKAPHGVPAISTNRTSDIDRSWRLCSGACRAQATGRFRDIDI